MELGEHVAVFREALFSLPIDYPISDRWKTEDKSMDGNCANTGDLSYNFQNVVA